MLKKASRGSEKQKIKMRPFANWVQGEALVDRGRGKEYDEKKVFFTKYINILKSFF